jgi:hypothetical protein
LQSIFRKAQFTPPLGHLDPFTPLEPATSTLAHDPNPSSSTTWGPYEQPPQPTPAAPKEVPAAVEGEVTSLREAPRHIQHCHLPQTMIGDIDQRVSRGDVRAPRQVHQGRAQEI